MKIPTPKTEVGKKTKLTIRYLYHDKLLKYFAKYHGYAPEEVEGPYWFGSVRPSVRASVRPSSARLRLHSVKKR